jgi:hypothetical protein
MTDNFNSVVVCDFEYEVAPGDLPDVLCMVAYVLDENLRHVLWRGEFGSTPPFDVGPDSLFVAYSAWAEITCFKVLGWKFPVHIYDQHSAYLAASNELLPYDPDERRHKPRKRLSDACRAYHIEGWERIDKETISKAIGDAPGANISAHKRSSTIAKRTSAVRRSCCVPNYAVPAAAMSTMCCAGRTTAPKPSHSSAWHADRYGAVEFGAGKQSCRHCCIDPTV